MVKAQFDMKFIHQLKDILLRLHYGESIEAVQEDFNQHVKDVNAAQILLSVQELKSGDLGITTEDIRKLFQIYYKSFSHSIHESHDLESYHKGHPVQVLKEENKAFQSVLNQINQLIEALGKDPSTREALVKELKEQMAQLGQFYNHYNRKEKLFFPILERYGYYTFPRMMWGEDDRIRNLYKGTKSMMERIPNIELSYVEKSFQLFANKFIDMIFEEEAFLLPITLSIFHEDDWRAIARESDAFGYSLVEPDEWVSKSDGSAKDEKGEADYSSKHFAFGGGYLTVQEANNIFNNLPLEITFVDKHGIFKYFNERMDSSEMMLVRTPISIGRNVANCHPPGSLSKVMRLIRDLKTKKRTSESMWFKKKDQYIHITYKGIFDDDGEFLGILEYVQDIQPFLELPREVKKELSILDE